MGALSRARLERATGTASFVLLVVVAAVAPASAHEVPPAPTAGLQTRAAATQASDQTTAALVTACTGPSPNQGSVPMPSPDQVITGSFDPSQQGSYVMVPFSVPVGTDALRVKYCHDQPTLPDSQGLNSHTIDMGLYEPDENANGIPDEPEFRGWGGSSRKDVTLSPEGTIDPNPNPVATQKTTVGYLPGPIPAGEWAAELGVAAVGQEPLAEDGVVQWRVEVDFIDDPAFANEGEFYSPVPYDTTPANPNPGWYAGDFHVHARHSAPGDATMRETFSYAFCPDPAVDPALCQALPDDTDDTEPGAGLDFITLSDYVTPRHWGEIGAFQDDYPGNLIIRSAEVITYRGHVNNHASVDFADYRTGPILRAQLSGDAGDPARSQTGVSPLRSPRPASAIFDEIHAADGWTQINHPQTFPSEIPTFGNLCRGCSWGYSDEETDYSKVDSIEVATGPAGLQQDPEPGPNPFTPLAIRFWEDAIDSGGVNANHIAAVGSSDSHNAGRTPNPVTQSPIGQATTVVYADELSEMGVQQGVEAGHTYVKMWGNDGPDLRLEATVPGSSDPPAIMGDTVEADQVSFTARVLNLNRAFDARPGIYTLFVVRDGLPLLTVPIPPNEYEEDEFSFNFPSVGPARYRLQVDREATGAASIEALSSPIYHEAAQGGPPQQGGPPPADGSPPPQAAPPPPGPCSQSQAGGDNGEKLTGTDLSDRILGNGGDDQIAGGDGDDCLDGGAGNDRVDGEGGKDRVKGGAGDDRLLGGAGRDRVRGSDGDDRIKVIRGGRDRVRCGPGKDRVKAGPNDRLRGCEVVK